jgi:hypothetical protein
MVSNELVLLDRNDLQTAILLDVYLHRLDRTEVNPVHFNDRPSQVLDSIGVEVGEVFLLRTIGVNLFVFLGTKAPEDDVAPCDVHILLHLTNPPRLREGFCDLLCL